MRVVGRTRAGRDRIVDDREHKRGLLCAGQCRGQTGSCQRNNQAEPAIVIILDDLREVGYFAPGVRFLRLLVLSSDEPELCEAVLEAANACVYPRIRAEIYQADFVLPSRRGSWHRRRPLLLGRYSVLVYQVRR